MEQVYLVQHHYDYADQFAAFADKPSAVRYAEGLARENAAENQQELETFWYEECQRAEGYYVTDGGDLWIQVHEIPFTPAAQAPPSS